jgi:hypothetical protein
MANKTKAKSNETLAQDIVNKFNHSLTWRNPFKEKWDRFYKMYRSYLDDTAYPWQSNVWVPYSFSTIETLAPRMVARRPQIDVMPREAADEEYADIQSKLIDFEWEAMKADDIIEDAVKSQLMYGTAILKMFWKTEKADVVKKEQVDETFPELGTVEEEVETTIFDGPTMELVDLYDFFWDPRAIDMESARWVAHRMYRTFEHLEQLQKEGVYKNVKLLEEATMLSADDEKSARRGTLGVAMPDELDQKNEGKRMIELIEYWEDDRVVTVANRNIVIRDEANPYRHGKKPFVRLIDQSVPHEFLGIGELEPIETLQYELNDRRNQRMDNVTLVLNRMWKVKNGANVDEDELVSDAGGVVHTDDMNGIEDLSMPDVTSSSYNEETLIKGDIQQTTGVSDFTRGIGSESLGNDTATGISLIQEAGNARFRLKIRNLESAIEEMGRMMVSLNEQFLSEEKVIRIMGDDGLEWVAVRPDDMRGNFDVMVQSGSTLPSNEAVERKQIMEMFQIFAGDPEVNQRELKKRVLETFGVKNLDKLLTPVAGVGPEGLPFPNEPQAGAPAPGQLDQQGILQSALAPERV